MAKGQKQKKDEPIPELIVDKEIDEIFSQEPATVDEQEMPMGNTFVYKDHEDSVIEEKPPSDELLFLCSLLEAQESGGWHGPVAGMIKERIKQIK